MDETPVFDEAIVRQFLYAYQQAGGLRPDLDVKTGSLNAILNPPTPKRRGRPLEGLRILNITVGPGKHSSKMFGGRANDFETMFDVPEDEFYVTINTIAILSGAITTFMMKKQDPGHKLYQKRIHARS